MATHLAAVSLAKGEPFTVQSRPTPKPGPGDLLIEVKSVALNPADHIMRQGYLVSTYPTVMGFDISGLVIDVGKDVPVGDANQSSGTFFQPGITRVAAYASSFFKSFSADYGAFQERCLVPWQQAMPLLSEEMSWNQAATLPVAVQVPLSAWDAMGILRIAEASGTLPSDEGRKDKDQKKKALLVWGASSSVGTMGVQTARLLREDRTSSFAAVYATAGTANHEYVASLGADRVFDYKKPQVVDEIVSAAKADGLVIRHCFLAMGQLASCQDVLKACIGEYQEGKREKSKIASAPIVPADAAQVEGLETMFLIPSMDEEERLAQYQYWMGPWLRENLSNGTIRPSPEPKVVGKGLGAINYGLDELLRGVSRTKLVVEVAE